MGKYVAYTDGKIVAYGDTWAQLFEILRMANATADGSLYVKEGGWS